MIFKAKVSSAILAPEQITLDDLPKIWAVLDQHVPKRMLRYRTWKVKIKTPKTIKNNNVLIVPRLSCISLRYGKHHWKHIFDAEHLPEHLRDGLAGFFESRATVILPAWRDGVFVYRAGGGGFCYIDTQRRFHRRGKPRWVVNPKAPPDSELMARLSDQLNAVNRLRVRKFLCRV